MKSDELIGVWNLRSCEGQSANDDRFFPYGQQPSGKLLYSADGTIAVVLMARERQQFASQDISQSTDIEIRKAFESFDSYAGQWELEEKSSIVTHHIECGKIPNWVGYSHKRHCSLNAGILTLKTEEFEMKGLKWVVSVVWERPQIG